MMDEQEQEYRDKKKLMAELDVSMGHANADQSTAKRIAEQWTSDGRAKSMAERWAFGESLLTGRRRT